MSSNVCGGKNNRVAPARTNPLPEVHGSSRLRDAPLSRHPVRHRLELGAFRTVEGLAGALPKGARDAAGAALGTIAGDFARVRRDVVESNIRHAFPEHDEAWVRRVARESYRHLGREALAMVALGASTPDEIRERTPITGLEPLKEALAQGRGVVMVTGHFGNWELAGASLAVRGIGIDGVVQRQRNPLVNREISAVRERLGLRIIDRRHASKLVPPALRDGRVVGFVADQDAGRHGVLVPFFGRPASTHRGAALFALRARAPLFLGVAVRQPDGTYDCRTEEIVVDRDGPIDEVVLRLTAAFTARLEAEIRTAPEQYFWVHRRWKSGPRPSGSGEILAPDIPPARR